VNLSSSIKLASSIQYIPPFDSSNYQAQILNASLPVGMRGGHVDLDVRILAGYFVNAEAYLSDAEAILNKVFQAAADHYEPIQKNLGALLLGGNALVNAVSSIQPEYVTQNQELVGRYRQSNSQAASKGFFARREDPASYIALQKEMSVIVIDSLKHDCQALELMLEELKKIDALEKVAEILMRSEDERFAVLEIPDDNEYEQIRRTLSNGSIVTRLIVNAFYANERLGIFQCVDLLVASEGDNVQRELFCSKFRAPFDAEKVDEKVLRNLIFGAFNRENIDYFNSLITNFRETLDRLCTLRLSDIPGSRMLDIGFEVTTIQEDGALRKIEESMTEFVKLLLKQDIDKKFIYELITVVVKEQCFDIADRILDAQMIALIKSAYSMKCDASSVIEMIKISPLEESSELSGVEGLLVCLNDLPEEKRFDGARRLLLDFYKNEDRDALLEAMSGSLQNMYIYLQSFPEVSELVAVAMNLNDARSGRILEFFHSDNQYTLNALAGLNEKARSAEFNKLLEKGREEHGPQSLGKEGQVISSSAKPQILIELRNVLKSVCTNCKEIEKRVGRLYSQGFLTDSSVNAFIHDCKEVQSENGKALLRFMLEDRDLYCKYLDLFSDPDKKQLKEQRRYFISKLNNQSEDSRKNERKILHKLLNT
jgi:hypothetical protein